MTPSGFFYRVYNMLSSVSILVSTFLRAILRDRVLHAVMGVAVVMLLLVPFLSSFSMRQVQELAITLSLSCVSVVLLVSTVLLGSASVWRDVERRFTTSLLTLPYSRAVYLVGKYLSIALFLLISTLLLGVCSAIVVKFAAIRYPSEIPIHWVNILMDLYSGLLKCLVLAAFTLLLSSLSTSFYLPFFGAIAIYFCGNASQEVYEYVNGAFGADFSPLAKQMVTGAYYILPNLSAFDFQIHAVYGLPIDMLDWLWLTCYAMIYSCILLGIAVFAFGRRQLP